MRSVNRRDEVRDLLSLPDGNPYDFYRDMKSWYRMIDPELADPARRYSKVGTAVVDLISDAIGAAEKLHTKLLMTGGDGSAPPKPYYHPHTYAFYGADKELKAFGQVRWVAREPSINPTALSPSLIRAATLVSATRNGDREVRVGRNLHLRFFIWPEDAHGDETVPVQSGAGPSSHVRQTFAPIGFRHQQSLEPEAMRLLVRHLIVKIVQEIQ